MSLKRRPLAPPRTTVLAYGLALLGLCACATPPTPDASADASADASLPPRVLVFSKTTGFRHDSIPTAVRTLGDLGAARGWQVTATEDAAVFTDAGLAAFDAVVFLLTSGDVLDDAQQGAFERYIRAGHGYVGVHSATDTEYDWAWYGGLVGAYFSRHPAGVFPAALDVRDVIYPAVSALPRRWMHADEWYTFRANPVDTPTLHVLLTLDEDSFGEDPSYRMGYHPVAWYQYYDGGRAFYTALGHPDESYAEDAFRAQLAAAVEWAAGARSPAALLEEFNGATPNGAWDIHQYDGTFEYHVTPTALEMVDRDHGNQHLTRRGVLVDPRRPYAIDGLFTIPAVSQNMALSDNNSFCFNLNVQGAGGSADDLAHLYTQAVNVDISGNDPSVVHMKSMGFVDGAFQQIGDHLTSCCRFDQEYRLRAEVNTAADGSYRFKAVTVSVLQGATVLDRLETDFSSFPYQPDYDQPVRVGVNTHGTDWTLRDLRVYYLDP